MSVKIPAICHVESNALNIVNESTRRLPQQAEVSIFIQIVLPDNLFPPFFFAQAREIRISDNLHYVRTRFGGNPWDDFAAS